MNIRKTGCLLLLLLFCLALTGCRIRTTESGEARVAGQGESAAGPEVRSGDLPDRSADKAEPENEQETGSEPGGKTRENPEASRKEYDENAPAEIVPGTERSVHGEGEGSGASAAAENADKTASMLNDEAEETATQTVAADEAEQMGVSEDAREADSAMTYYTVLLQERMGGLFECKRLNVYWETEQDHVTVFKKSLEHSLILNAGAYDVSSRLLEENLRVDDGWIVRKNPGVIIKTVGSGILGKGVASTAAAQKAYADLIAREGWSAVDAVRNGRVLLLSEELLAAPHLQTAAMLMIAGTANPELMADVEIGRALEMLSEEATGSIPSGIYAYGSRGELR